MRTKEQSLILEAEKGAAVLTGCAHPGIVNVIKGESDLTVGGIHLVIGGYHLFSAGGWEIIKVIEAFEESDVQRACPCHCTGDSAISLFRESYGEDYIRGGAGRVIGIF